jgi:hypothetical protein
MHRRLLSAVLAVVFSGLAVPSVAVQTQREAVAPIRLGRFATQLTPQDVANLEPVLPGGAKPWLLFGGECLFCEASVSAYLHPTIETTEMRRGRFLVVRPPAGLIKGAMPMPNAPAASSWTLTERSFQYAQVAVAGRRFEQVESVQDLHKPFSVMADFDDAELLSIVGFARSNSRWAGPMEVVNREADGSVRVQIRVFNGSGRLQAVIRREGQSWAVLKEWIVSAD